MKKVLLLSAFTFILIHTNIFAQPLPNGGFETWSSNVYNEPNGWYTGNLKSLSRMGVTPVTRVTGQSGYALRIETFVVGGDTSDSYISNSLAGDPMKGQGGVPYSQIPTALTGYYRYNLPGNDSAGILAFFKKNGTVFSQNLLMIRNLTGSQPTFFAFNLPISLPFAPDTVIIAAISSNMVSGVGIQNGSFIEFDQLAFASTTQIIPNGDFESWTSQSFDTPSGWEFQGDSISKTTDKYSGTYAIRMKTSLSQDGMVNSSGITTGHNTNNGPQTGGRPYTLTQDTLTGYYKYITSGPDTANVYVFLSKNASPVGGMGMPLLPVSNYTYFQMPFFVGSTPDSIIIGAYSSNYPLSPSALGSTLFLDGLSLKSMTTGVFGPADHSLEVIAYPNPANDVLHIEFGKSFSGDLRTSVYDVTGRLVKEENLPGNLSRFQLNIADLNQGSYQVELMTADGVVWKRFIKE